MARMGTDRGFLGLGHWAQKEATEAEAFCPRGGRRQMRGVAQASLHFARNLPVIAHGHQGGFPVETARMEENTRWNTLCKERLAFRFRQSPRCGAEEQLSLHGPVRCLNPSIPLERYALLPGPSEKTCLL